MKPATLIELCAVASLATASPAWGCHGQPIYSHYPVAGKISSDIIDDAPVETEIASTRVSDTVYSGYDLLKMDLKGYSLLDDGWDGPESKAASAQAIGMALQFVDKLPSGIPLPKPMLSSNGKVGLYWDVEAIYADVGFEEDDRLSIFVRDRRDEDRETFVELRLPDLRTEQLKAILAPLALA